MNLEKLLKVTADKKSIRLSLAFGLVNVIIVIFFFVIVFLRYLNPDRYSDLIYAHGYGLYARDFSIYLGVFLIVYITILFVLVRKPKVNVLFTSGLLLPILVVTVIGLIVVSVKESRSLASYTTNINHYGVYDESVTGQMQPIVEYLPKKENINRYEYFLVRRSSLWGSFYQFSMFVETGYDETVHAKITGNEQMQKKDDVDNPLLSGYDCYEYLIQEGTSHGDPLVERLHILINESEQVIVYVVTNFRTDVFQASNNYFYIGSFIDDDRNSPFDLYQQDH